MEMGKRFSYFRFRAKSTRSGLGFNQFSFHHARFTLTLQGFSSFTSCAFSHHAALPSPFRDSSPTARIGWVCTGFSGNPGCLLQRSSYTPKRRTRLSGVCNLNTQCHHRLFWLPCWSHHHAARGGRGVSGPTDASHWR